LFGEISTHFGVGYNEIKFDIIEDLDEKLNLVITVKEATSSLGERHYSSCDFQTFCEQSNLTGMIFFNKDGCVTFSMTPLPVVKVAKSDNAYSGKTD
jgi:hypothetical protein